MEKEYNKWNFFGTLFIVFLTLLILFYTIPKQNLDIFYDPIKNSSYFIISNLGEKAAKEIKVSYSLECQEIQYFPEYISKEVPILTGSNGPEPFYLHFLDNETFRIISESQINKEKCYSGVYDIPIFIPFSKKVDNDNEIDFSPDEVPWKTTKSYNFTLWFCDPCELILTAESGKKISKVITFANPIQLDFEIFCIDGVERFECYNNMHTYQTLKPKYDLFNLSYTLEGVFLKLNSNL